MRPGLALEETPVELMHPLEGDGATFLGPEQLGDFLPCLALLALLPDEVNKGLQPAVKCASASAPGSCVTDWFQIHRTASLPRQRRGRLARSGRVKQNGAGLKANGD